MSDNEFSLIYQSDVRRGALQFRKHVALVLTVLYETLRIRLKLLLKLTISFVQLSTDVFATEWLIDP